MREGSEIDLDARALQPPLGLWILVLMVCSIVCIPFVLCRIVFVSRGEVVLAKSFRGAVRILRNGA